MSTIPKHVEESITSWVKRDLQPSLATVIAKTGVAIGVGGAISLFLCGQFGFGFNQFSNSLNHGIHNSLGSIGCAVLCGAFFAIIPITLMRVISTPLQFKIILSKFLYIPILWISGFGLAIMLNGNFGQELLQFFVWVAAAFGAYQLLGFAFTVLKSPFSTTLME